MMLRQYAAEHGLTVVDEYIDDGWSGTNFDRPSFQRMIDDIEEMCIRDRGKNLENDTETLHQNRLPAYAG